MRAPEGQRRRAAGAKRVTVVALLAAALLTACDRDREGVGLVAPFNEHTRLGTITATWVRSGEVRSFARGARLKQPEVAFQYRVNVQNDLADGLFVRLGELELVDEEGGVVARAAEKRECTLGSGRVEGVLTGTLWVPAHAANALRSFRIARFGVPLSDRGRALFREWRLQGRHEQRAEVDAEIAAYASAPPCVAR